MEERRRKKKKVVKKITDHTKIAAENLKNFHLNQHYIKAQCSTIASDAVLLMSDCSDLMDQFRHFKQMEFNIPMLHTEMAGTGV